MARSLDGSADYMRTTSTVVDTSDRPFTVSCWAKRPATDTFLICQIQDASATNQYWDLLMRGAVGGNTLYWGARDSGGTVFAETANTVTAGEWQHCLAVELSPGTPDRYVCLNGDTANAGTEDTAKAPTGVDSMDIGRRGDSSPGSPTEGEIAFLAVWSGLDMSADTAAIQALAKGVHPYTVYPDKLVNFWPFNGTGSPEPDLISGNDLTLTSAPPQSESPLVPHPWLPNWSRQAAAAPAAGVKPPSGLALMGVGS